MKMISEHLKRIGYTQENGFIDCEDKESFHISEKLHITERASKLGASYVLFRRYVNDKGEITNAKPSVYVFEKEKFSDNQLIELHAKVWSAGEVDVYMVIDNGNIKIYNARKPAENKNTGLTIETLILCSEALKDFNDQRFSAHIFGKGMFWEQENRTWELDEKQTPFHILLEQLQKAKILIQKKYKKEDQKSEIASKLLLLSILIMFLEEKKDKNNNSALKNIFNEFKINSFSEVLKNNLMLLDFLQKLSDNYNGNIFNLEEIEKDILKDLDLLSILLFVEGKTDIATKQVSIWRNYDFDFIPIELISSVYEEFLSKDDNNGAFYTPILLVNFLIDEVMPLDLPKENYLKNNKIHYKILDPTCGSGVFLVAAYKRLLDWWFINNYDKVQSLSKKEISDIFKEILENNIFGVDINEIATQISIFSLTIAFLDKIDPKLLWGKFQFQNLSNKNINRSDFFEWASENKQKKFDLIIGNPPFIKFNHTYIKEIEQYRNDLSFDYCSRIPDSSALYFLEFARVLSPQKKVCLIIPSTLLLYSPQNTSINYRKALLENTNVEKIYDFTHLREALFVKNNLKQYRENINKSGRIPVCAIILNNAEPQYKNIEHIIVKRVVSFEKKLRFEIDHYDHHIVRFDWACNYPFVWKCNLLGGGRLFHLIYRLSLLQNLNDFIKEKQKKNNWIYSNGYIGQYGNEANNKKVDFLNGKPRIKPRTFDEFGNFIKEDIPENKYFWNTRVHKLYEPPHIVFKLVVEDKKIPMAWIDEYLCFNSSFVGIAAPEIDKEDLYKIYKRLHKDENISNLYRAFILATSSKALVYHETSIIKEDIDNLPFPNFTKEEEEYLVLTETEKILRDDVLNHYKHLGKSINGDAYEVLERKLNISKSKDLEILHDFGKVFCNNLNEIYAKNGKSWQIGNICQTKHNGNDNPLSENFIVYQIGFGLTTSKKETIEVDETYIKNLIFDTESNRGAIWVRTCKIYQHTENGYDCVFLIKPANIRYWLRSIALRDAGDVFKDLKNAKF
ncbi:MAG: hypothetical protein EAZ85_04750 [Bacteroidetes bacterium]|nr:MAG: hypothetical protein EAZ85_04750 [Bacteroidota bacterium]TAG90206.1 MAG: hypothetical protein EAZ20_04975 [Bacteroidota bacterium]